jgi:hypothetical protein
MSNVSRFQIFLTKMVRNYCGCVSLKTGTLIIGSLNIVVYIIGIFASFYVMTAPTVSATILQYEAGA